MNDHVLYVLELKTSKKKDANFLITCIGTELEKVRQDVTD